MTLDRIMFDHVISYPFTFMVICVRAKAFVLPRILNDIAMHVVVKGDVFLFIKCGCTKNSNVLCELRQDWFQFVSIYKTQMPHINVMKKVRCDGIELCAIFGGTRLFSRSSGIF